MINKLKSLGLKVTPQRLAIMKLLDGNIGHPSAEEIYNALKPDFPSLSLATVYNTLEALCEAKEIQEVRIKRDKRHFDPNVVPHTHFLCRICDKIYDLELDVQSVQLQIPLKMQGCQVDGYTLHLYGTCPACMAKIADNNNQQIV